MATNDAPAMNDRKPDRFGLRRGPKRPSAVAFHRRDLRVEWLEERQLLSGAPPEYAVSAEFRVNTTTAGDQEFEAFGRQNIAMDADGDAVVVWVSGAEDGSLTGVFAQRYVADGAPVGGQFQINGYTQNRQENANVAMDADGDFVVSWSSLLQDGSDYGVYARLYDATGRPRGREFRVNETTEGYQRLSSVAMDAQGDFVITWAQRRSLQEFSETQIKARMFGSDGQPESSEFRVNEFSADTVFQPHVARNARGDFVITWLGRNGSLPEDVFARAYAPDGSPYGPEYRVNEYSPHQQIGHTVAINAAGQLAIAWYNQTTIPNTEEPRNVYVRRFSLDGAPLGGDVRINTSAPGEYRYPALAFASTGDFVTVWAGKKPGAPSAHGYEIFSQYYDAQGEPLGGETQLNTTVDGEQTFPSIGMDGDGDFIVAWRSAGQDGSGFGIYARRFSQELDLASPVVGNVYVAADDHAISDGEILVQHPERLVVTFSEAIDTPPGNARGQWRLTRNGADESQRIAVVSYVFNGATNRNEAMLDFNGPLPAGDYELIALPTVRDVQGRSLDGNYDGVGGDAFARAFTIAVPVATGNELAINNTTIGDQSFTAGVPGTIARDAQGNFTIVWTGPGIGSDIYARRFDALGAPLSEVDLVVNSLTTGEQTQPTIAMAADGGFAVVWTSLGELGGVDLDYADIYVRRFSAVGVALGPETRVNVADFIPIAPVPSQQRPTIAMNSSGDFVVAWETSGQPGGSNVDVHFQRYSRTGAKLGVETAANDYKENSQSLPHVAMDEHGNFLLTWTSRGQDLMSPINDSVYARRFSAAEGQLLATEFRVNGVCAQEQRNSAVAMDQSGRAVVVWQSNAGGTYDIFARRVDAGLLAETTLACQASEPFRVNDVVAGTQLRPSVAMDRNGDFVVAWQSNVPGTQTANDIVARRFSWNGIAQGDEITIPDELPANQQTLANVSVDANGNFVLAWTNRLSDGTLDIVAQRFAGFVNAPPVASAGGPYGIVEGQNLTLNASASTDVDAGHTAQLSYAWDLDRDGAFDDVVGAGPTATVTWDALLALGITDDGQYSLAVRVTDPLGASSTAEATFSLSNAPPTVTLQAGEAIEEGEFATLSGAIADAGPADQHEVRIDWGDASVETVTLPAGQRVFELTHLYLNNYGGNDPYKVRVTVVDDDDGQSPIAETSLLVLNAKPSIVFHQLSAGPYFEGRPVTIVGRFQDAGVLDTHTVTIHWGEVGTPPVLASVNPLTREFTATHTYADNLPAAAMIVMEVVDFDGGAVAASIAALVRNANPEQLQVTPAMDVVAVGDLVTLSGTFVDSGLRDSHTVTIVWGDGGSPDSFTVALGARAFTGSHRYLGVPPQNSASIQVSVRDNDLGIGVASTSVRVIACGLPGDTNFDCAVNLDDLNSVRNNFGQSGGGGRHIAGDAYPFDGAVDLNDLNGVRNYFGASAAPAQERRLPSDFRQQALDAVFARWSALDERDRATARTIGWPAKRRSMGGAR